MENSSKTQNDESIDLYHVTMWLWSQKYFLGFLSGLAAIISIIVALALPNQYISNTTLMPKDTQLNVSLTGGGGGGFDFGGLSQLVGLSQSMDKDPNVTLAKELLVSQQFLVDFVKKYQYLPELLQAIDYKSGAIVYSSEGYDQAGDEMLYMPSDTDIYKAFLLRFTINYDRLTNYSQLGFEHVSPPFAQELLTNLIEEVNDHVREREVERAEKSIVFLDKQLAQTTVKDLSILLSKLKEKNLKTLMLAEIDERFILDIVDPPTLPTEKSKPYRALIVVFGTFFGFLLGVFILGIYRLFQYELIFTLFPFKFKRNKLNP